MLYWSNTIRGPNHDPGGQMLPLILENADFRPPAPRVHVSSGCQWLVASAVGQRPESPITVPPIPDLAGNRGGNPRFPIRPKSGNRESPGPGPVSRFGRDRESGSGPMAAGRGFPGLGRHAPRGEFRKRGCRHSTEPFGRSRLRPVTVTAPGGPSESTPARAAVLPRGAVLGRFATWSRRRSGCKPGSAQPGGFETRA